MAPSLSKKPKKPLLPRPPYTGLGAAAGGVAAPPKGVNRPLNGPPTSNIPKPAAAAAPAPRAAAGPSAANPSVRPPVTTAGAGLRSRAQSTYEAALRTGRQGIVEAALRLGSPEILNALKADPNFAEYAAAIDKGMADPTSMMAQAKYSEDKSLQGVDEDSNSRNTYFSSKRQNDREDVNHQFNNARSGYLSDYQSAYNTLFGNMGAAQGQLNNDLADADNTDLNAWLALAPQPTGPDPGAAPASSGPAAPAGQPVVPGMTPQQVSQAIAALNNPNYGHDMPGMAGYKGYEEKAGKDSHGNPGVWHIYPDGRKVFIRRK